jgi:cell division septation protein DedD
LVKTTVRGQEVSDRYEDDRQDTEITLGVGNLLAVFFGLVILCGIALGAGYLLGRNSGKQALAAQVSQAAATQAAVNAMQSAPTGVKPAAAQAAAPKATDCASGDPNCTPQPAAAAPASNDLTFYQAVQQKDPKPQLTPPETAPSPAAVASAVPAVNQAPAAPRASLGNGYMVQIAAVSHEDDAKLLSETLKKQQYPAIVTQPGDKLFHVQVGPYADVKEAEAMRARLVSGGYNAFVKH